jgi:MFS family permease
MLTSHALPARRVHRIAVSSFFYLAGFCFASWASRIPAIQQKLDLDNATLGEVLLCIPCGLIASLPLAGWLVARFGSKPVVVSASILYASTLPLIGAVQTVWQLAMALFIFGTWGNMLNIGVNTQAIGTESMYDRPIMASYHGTWSLGGLSGAAVGNGMVALHWLPWQHFLLITGLALGLAATFAGRLIPLDIGSGVVTGADQSQGQLRDRSLGSRQPIFAWPDRSLIQLGVIAFCSMICEGTMFDWSGVYFQKVIHPAQNLVLAGYTAFMATMATGRFVGDWLTGKWGSRRIMQISGLLTAGGLLTAVLFPRLETAIGGFLLVGAGVSSVIPLVYSAAGRSKVLSPGVALAAVSTIGYLGFVAGPPCIGFIAQAFNLRVSLGLIAILGATITVLASRVKLPAR